MRSTLRSWAARIWPAMVATILVVAWLVILWFASDWFSTPNCDPYTAYDHCEQASGSGPGNK